MLSDIVSALDLVTNSPKFILASKDLKSDLNFVFCEVLADYIKNNYAVVLINFAQSYSHYNHVFLKSGINIKQLHNQKKVLIIDALSDMEKASSGEEDQKLFWTTIFSDTSSCDCLKYLYYRIKECVELLKSLDSNRPIIIFIDEISILLNMGISIRSIEPFVKYCLGLNFEAAETSTVLFMGTVKNEIDIENSTLTHYLSLLCDVNIEVEGLKTGYSKEADGKITLCTKNKEGKSLEKQLLFKVTEKGAKLLTSGL